MMVNFGQRIGPAVVARQGRAAFKGFEVRCLQCYSPGTIMSQIGPIWVLSVMDYSLCKEIE